MQRIITLIYVIITASIAVFCTIFEIQPALFIIDIFAPNVGDSYSVNLVVLLLWLILLSPLLIFLSISKLMRKKEDKNISSERTGIFVTRKKAFQSAMVGIPIYINDKKAGIIDNGKTKFFDTPIGTVTVHAGIGKQVSEKVQVIITEKQQLQFELKFKQSVFTVKIILNQILK